MDSTVSSVGVLVEEMLSLFDISCRRSYKLIDVSRGCLGLGVVVIFNWIDFPLRRE